MARFIILRSGLKSLIGPGMVFMLSVSPAMAYTDRNDIEFHVTGNIIDGSCNVTKPEAVDLGKYYWKDFAVAGGNTGNVPVTIAFDSCTAGLSHQRCRAGQRRELPGCARKPNRRDDFYCPNVYPTWDPNTGCIQQCDYIECCL